MNRKEATQILAILKAAYPNTYKGMTKEAAAGTVAIWAMQFSDIPVDIVMMAVNKAISSSPFPPAISDVRSKFSALHWEAYEILQCRLGQSPLPEKEQAQISRIYRETEKFRYEKHAEPKLDDMLMDSSFLMLSGGENL